MHLNQMILSGRQGRPCRVFTRGNATALRPWPSGNIAQPVVMLVACLAVIAALIPVSHAAEAAEQDAPIPDRAVRVDYSEAREAFVQAERWVRQGGVGERARPIWVRDVVGVRIDLRWAGMPAGPRMGYGEAYADNAEGVADLSALVHEATGQAIERMLRTYRQAMESPGDEDEGRLRPADLGARMLVELQIGRGGEAIRMDVGEQANAIFHKWAVGYHGLRITRPDDRDGPRTAIMWPATALAANMAPENQLYRLLADVEYDVADGAEIRKVIERIGQLQGPRLERFPIIHVVRPSRTLPITRLVRGNRPANPSDLEVDMPTMAVMGQRMAGHLVSRQRRDGSFSGTYEPSRDNEPGVASPGDAALALYALVRRLEWVARYDPDRQQIRELQDACENAVEYLRRLHRRSPESYTPATRALLLLALIDGSDLAGYRDLRDRMARELIDQQDDAGAFTGPDEDGRRTRLSNHEQALVAAAITAYYAATGDERARDASEASRDFLWDDLWPELSPGSRLELMPWAGMLELRAQQRALAAGESDREKAKRSIRAGRLEALGERLLARQVRNAPQDGPSDVLGGMVFARRLPDNAVPNPDWRTAHALMYLATTLQVEGAIPQHERNQWLLASGRAAGFLSQLMYDDPSLYYVRNRSMALGGVRVRLWDNRLPLGPTAMGLVAVSELQQGILP